MIINKKIIRTMKMHKAQYIGSIVLISISCILFSMFNIMGINITRNLKDFKKYNVQEDASVILQNKLNDIPLLENTYNLILEERGAADYEFNEKSTLRVLSKTEKIDKYAVVKGRDISGTGEVLLDPGFAKAHNIDIKSHITIFRKDFVVVGFTSSPDYIYPLKSESDMIKNPDAFGIAIVSKDDFENLKQGFKFYSLKFKGGGRSAFENYIHKNNTVIKWVNREDNMRITFIEGDLKGVEPMGKVLPVVILLVTCVLVSVILWRLLKQEFSQIGVLYALGYRKKEILKHYLSYPIMLSLPGSITGTIVGIILVNPFIAFIASFYNLPVFSTGYEMKYLFISLILPFAFLIPSTILVVVKALKLSPLELLRGGGNKIKTGFWEKKLSLNRLNFNTKFKIREVLRNIPRSLLMLLGVTFAAALLLVGFSTKDSMDYLMNKSFDETFQYQYDYMFNSIQTEKATEGEIVSLGEFTTDKGHNENNNFIIYGMEKNAKLVSLKDSKGNLLSMDQVIVTRALANKNNIHEGDYLPVKNTITSREYTLKVDKIAEFYLGEFVYMPIDSLNIMCGYPPGSYLELYSTRKLDIKPESLISANNKEDIIEGYKTMVKPFQYMIGMIGFAAFIIGLIIIYVVTSLVIEENRGNISLLKILGYGKKSIYALVLNTNTWFVIIGYLLAIPLVFYSMGAFFDILTADMNMSIPVRLHILYILAGFIFIFLTYELAKFLNRKKITNIQMADSLKNKME